MAQFKRNSKEVPWENVITPIQENILKSLAKYMYLTLRQILNLDVGTAQYTYLWKQMASLRDRRRPLVNCTSFSTPQPKKGRVESVYSLSSFGKRVLIEEFDLTEDEIRAPSGRSFAYRDYFHRRYTIDFHIALEQWANANKLSIPLFETYFDKVGNNRTSGNLRSKTKIEISDSYFIIPDATFLIDGRRESELFLFEMHNGKDTKRMLKQIHQHAQAMVSRAVHKQYHYDTDKRYRVLILFELKNTMEAFIKRASQEKVFRLIQEYFLLKSLEELNTTPIEKNWKTLWGNEISSMLF